MLRIASSINVHPNDSYVFDNIFNHVHLIVLMHIAQQ
jgi:hypothetical protein